MSYDRAVAVADQALAAGADPGELAEALGQARRWHGCGQARRVVAFADSRSESVGESFSRVTMAELELPVPVLQLEVFDDNGYLLGRGDFGWPERRTLGEFDGRVKYSKLLRPGEGAEDAVYREKLREDALRDQGWQMARWVWDDLKTPQVIADRVLRAFARAGHPYAPELLARSRSGPRSRSGCRLEQEARSRARLGWVGRGRGRERVGPSDGSAPRTGTVRGAACYRAAARYEMRSVSSWIRSATCLSLSSCSLPWWAQKRSSKPLAMVTRT